MTNMVIYKTYVAGWLESSVHDFLGEFPENPKPSAFALVTCVDSELAPASLLRANPKWLQAGGRILGNGLLFPTQRLKAPTFREALFVGFDEVWFFPDDKVEPKPDVGWIVGPGRVRQETIDKLGPWMLKNGCSLGLGDGVGLNLIVKASGLVRNIIANSLLQPEPTLTNGTSWNLDGVKA
jgi:hypothetical protein